MKMLTLNNFDSDSNGTKDKVKEDEDEDDKNGGKNGGDSFAERAEAYYEERPQLLSLLRDLYNCYLSLADRYCQTLAKHHLHHHHRRQRSSPITITRDAVHSKESDSFSDRDNEEEEGEEEENENDNSDAESSLSYQQPSTLAIQNPNDHGSNTIVVELVMKMVEHDIVVNEVEEERRRWGEWWRKIELQKSLVEVLESERMILLNENARLGYRVMAVVDENKSLAAETVFVKRKAAELARCLFKMREDHRVSLLTCKIQDLQAQIYGLERTRNKKDDLIANSSSSISSYSNGSHSSDHDAAAGGGRRRSRSVKKVSKWWWSRVKSFDLLIPARMCTDAT